MSSCATECTPATCCQNAPKATNTVKMGLYRHYKGDIYRVLGVAHHSETAEELVIYQGQHYCPEFGNNPIWARPAAMFLETVTINGKEIARFEYIGQ